MGGCTGEYVVWAPKLSSKFRMDVQEGPLNTAFDGPRPEQPLYNPMKKPGGLVLGLGGDTSNGGHGTFYEGVVTKGYSSDEADEEIQANIVAARYGV